MSNVKLAHDANTVLECFSDIDAGKVHHWTFSHANVVMVSKEHYAALQDAVYEAEKQAGPVAGWKLVPELPTQDMEHAGIAMLPNAPDVAHWWVGYPKAAYLAMLAAAPPAPPSPLTEQDKEDAERYTIDEITEAVLYAEIPDGQFESMLISLEAIRAARAKKEQP